MARLRTVAWRGLAVAAIVSLYCLPASAGTRQVPEGAPAAKPFRLCPSLFVENKGQWPSDVKYGFIGRGGSVEFTEEGLTLRGAGGAAVCRVRFERAKRIMPTGLEPSGAKFNYYVGNDPSKWFENVGGYDSVAYKGLYDGIDLYVRRTKAGLKYEFHVAPGADPATVVIRYDGAGGLELGDSGALHVDTSAGEIVDAPPAAYQETADGRREIDVNYRLTGDTVCGFEIGAYDRSRVLVIDPDLAWGTYLGGSSVDSVSCIRIDDSDDIWVFGGTGSADFPASNGFDSTPNGGGDAFIAKIAPAGDLLWATYLGGDWADGIWTAALDAAGDAVIIGQTSSSDFPTPNGFQTVKGGGDRDLFISKVTSSGTLAWSTYLGGSREEMTDLYQTLDLALDGSGAVFMVSTTSSSDFPLLHPFDRAYRSITSWLAAEVVVAKFSSSGTLLWSSYLGGSRDEEHARIHLDASGDLFIVGETSSSDFPVKNAFDSKFRGPEEGRDGWPEMFAAKVTSDGSLAWSSYLGGTHITVARDSVLDKSGDLVVLGVGYSASFSLADTYKKVYGDGGDFVARITSQGRLEGVTFAGGAGELLEVDDYDDVWIVGGLKYAFSTGDVYVAKVKANGDLEWSQYFGGSAGDYVDRFTLDKSGGVIIQGDTYSADFPVRRAFQSIYGGNGDLFFAKVTSSGEVAWASYLGGSGCDRSDSFAGWYLSEEYRARWKSVVDGAGNIVFLGETESADFPMLNASDTTCGGPRDIVVGAVTGEGELGWASYLGGNLTDYMGELVIDSVGDIWVGGRTYSEDFPAPGGFDTTLGGEQDGFLVRIACGPPQIATQGLPDGVLRVRYSRTLSGTRGTPPYRWYVTAGSLPSGLSLDESSGELHGRPSAVGIFTFTVELRDNAQVPRSDSKEFSVTVTEDSQGPLVSSVGAVPDVVRIGTDTSLALSAVADDTTTGAIKIAAAEYFVGTPGAPGEGTSMQPADGSFNSPLEALVATVGVTGWSAPAEYTIYVRAQDEAQNWGPVAGVTVQAIDGIPPAAVTDLDLTHALTWNRVYAAGWQPLPANSPDQQSTTIDLGESKVVGGVTFTQGNAAYFPIQFTISVSDNGTDWTDVAAHFDAKARTGAHLWRIQTGEYRYVRIIASPVLDKKDGKYHLDIPEVGVWETTEDNYVKAAWTAPSDDGSDPAKGPAAEYDMRRSTSAIRESAFSLCDAVSGLPVPAEPGQTEEVTFSVGDFLGNLFTALKARDEVDNWSALSNCAQATVEPIGILLIWPTDMMRAVPWNPETFFFAAPPSVSAVAIAFSDRPDFPAKPLLNPDGSVSRTVYGKMPSVRRWWKGSPGQWKQVKRLYRQTGNVYWRVEGKSAEYGRIVSATRVVPFDVGTITGIHVSLTHDKDGDEAIWPTAATRPEFHWTDDSRGMKYYFVDVSTDPLVPRDKTRTLSFCGKAITPGAYQLTASEWKKLRQFARGSQGVVYWRVRAADRDKALECTSGIEKLVIDGGTWTVGDLDLGAQPPAATWTHTGQGIVAYRLQFSANEDFSGTLRETVTLPSKGVTGTSYVLPSSVVTNLVRLAQANAVTALHYRIRGEDADRAFVAFSDAKTVDVP